MRNRRAEKYENGERRHCLENCQSGVPGGPILGGGATAEEAAAATAEARKEPAAGRYRGRGRRRRPAQLRLLQMPRVRVLQKEAIAKGHLLWGSLAIHLQVKSR